jgi:phytoene/squalene synthetase
LTLLRALPHSASRLQKVHLPISLLAEHQVSTESIIRNNFDSEGLKSLVESLAAIADDHLSNTRFRAKYLDKDEKLVFLPAVVADRYMARLVRAQCDVFNTQLLARDSWLPAVLYWNKFRCTY